MTQTTKQLVDEINNLKGLCVEQILSQELDDIDEKGIKAAQTTLRVIRLSNQLMIEQAEMMEAINKKLDKLLEKK